MTRSGRPRVNHFLPCDAASGREGLKQRRRELLNPGGAKHTRSELLSGRGGSVGELRAQRTSLVPIPRAISPLTDACLPHSDTFNGQTLPVNQMRASLLWRLMGRRRLTPSRVGRHPALGDGWRVGDGWMEGRWRTWQCRIMNINRDNGMYQYSAAHQKFPHFTN